MFSTYEMVRAFAYGWGDGERGAGHIDKSNAHRVQIPEGLSFETADDCATAYRLGFWSATKERANEVLGQ